MIDQKSIIAMIPARIGSERLKKKNLVLLNGKPLIEYAIIAARTSSVFDKIIVNSDHFIFEEIAKNNGVGFYHRPGSLAASETNSDDVVYDFIKSHRSDILVWVNPIAPLQEPSEISTVIKFFIKENFDSLVTVRNHQVHCNFKNRPLNFKLREKFVKTQDLDQVQCFVYSLMMWKTDSFIKNFKKNGYALLCGRVGYYPVSRLSSIIIKYDEDIKLCESILKNQEENKKIDYYKSKNGLEY